MELRARMSHRDSMGVSVRVRDRHAGNEPHVSSTNFADVELHWQAPLMTLSLNKRVIFPSELPVSKRSSSDARSALDSRNCQT